MGVVTQRLRTTGLEQHHLCFPFPMEPELRGGLADWFLAEVSPEDTQDTVQDYKHPRACLGEKPDS